MSRQPPPNAGDADAANARGPRRTHRLWLPILVLAAAVAAAAWLWNIPTDDLPRADRVTGSIGIGLLAGLLLFGWFLFLSRFGAWPRMTVSILVLALAGGAVASVRDVEFTGDMVPSFRFRWQPSPEELVEASRKGKGQASRDVAIAATQDRPVYRWPNWTGVLANETVRVVWEKDPPQAIWRQPVGLGYSAFSIVGDLAVTLEQRRAEEAVVAYDLSTAKERWIHAYPARFSETLGGDGPRSTPTIVDGEVYSLGATGWLTCVSLSDGKKRWATNILEENGVRNLDWGMAGSPLVYDNLVVCNPGNQKGTESSRGVVAYSRATGAPVWKSGKHQASYATPMLADVAGRRQILIFDAAGLAGHDPKSGEELWRTPWESPFLTNAAQPIVYPDGRIFITSAAGAEMLEISQKDGKYEAAVLWKNRNLKGGYQNPVAHGGHIYGLDEGILVCIEEKSGKRAWKAGRYGHGQLLLAKDVLVILSEKGDLALVKADPAQYQELARWKALEGKTWNNPVLAGGYLFVRNHEEMACYDLRPGAATN